jgi:hypothetical protein
MLTDRFRIIIASLFAASGLSEPVFARLPLFAPPTFRKTVDFYQGRARRSRYTGAKLREIRATGQARECARRQGRAVALAA